MIGGGRRRARHRGRATLVLPIAVRGVIDHGFSAEDASRIGQYFLALVAVAAVMGMAAAVRFYLVTWIGERVTADVRAQSLRSRAVVESQFLRDHAHRRSAVASHRRHHADTVVVGSSASFALRNLVMAVGRSR
jgi:ATP-binding cassette subfamily B protein